MQNNFTAVGIDLGTFQTSVISSNGRRKTVESVVGWAEDRVARSMLGKDVAVGAEAMENRRALKVVRPFRKGMLKYNAHNLSTDELALHKKAAKLLIEEAISQTSPPNGMPVYGVIGAPSNANLANREFILEVTESVFDRVLMISEPFAVAYAMDRLKGAIIVDIGAGTIDICPMYGSYPLENDEVTVPVGGDLIDEIFCTSINEMSPRSNVSLNLARQIKERHGFVHDTGERAIIDLPTDGKPEEFDITDVMKEACQTIVAPLLEGLNQVIVGIEAEYRQTMLNNVVVSGGGSQLKGLDTVLEVALHKQHGAGKVTKVFDSVYAVAFGAFRLASSMQLDEWQKLDEPVEDQLAKPQPATEEPLAA